MVTFVIATYVTANGFIFQNSLADTRMGKKSYPGQGRTRLLQERRMEPPIKSGAKRVRSSVVNTTEES